MRQSPMLEYPVTEFEQRKAAAAAKMREAGLDYILAASRAMVCHLTGLRSVAWKSKLSTPGLILMDADGNWGVVGSRSAVDTALYTSCVDEADYYFFDASGSEGIATSYPEAICYTMERLGIARGRIGCELDNGFHLHLDLSLFQAIQAKFPGLEFVDASHVFWEIMAVKSDAQIRNLQTAEGYHIAAVQKGLAGLAPGKTTEMALYKAVARAGYEAGSEHFTYVSVLSGPERALCADCPPSETQVISPEPGTIIRVEGSGVRRELHAPFTANLVVGGIQPRQQEVWDLAGRMLQAALGAVKAGAPAGSVADAADRCAEAAGRPEWNASRGYAGSGIGWSREDGPALRSGSRVPLREHMVLTITVVLRHPSVGELALRQNVIVAAGGYIPLLTETHRPIVV